MRADTFRPKRPLSARRAQLLQAIVDHYAEEQRSPSLSYLLEDLANYADELSNAGADVLGSELLTDQYETGRIHVRIPSAEADAKVRRTSAWEMAFGW